MLVKGKEVNENEVKVKSVIRLPLIDYACNRRSVNVINVRRYYSHETRQNAINHASTVPRRALIYKTPAQLYSERGQLIMESGYNPLSRNLKYRTSNTAALVTGLINTSSTPAFNNSFISPCSALPL